MNEPKEETVVCWQCGWQWTVIYTNQHLECPICDHVIELTREVTQ